MTMGLRKRVILIITIPAMLAMAVHGGVRIYQERAQVISDERESLALTAKAVQIAVENALRDRQFADVERLVSAMVEQQETIDGMRLFDRALNVTLVSSPEAVAKAVPENALRRVMESETLETRYERRETRSAISVLAPLRGRTGRVEGAMEIVRLVSGLDRRMQAAVNDVVIRLGLVLVVTIGLTSLVLQRQVLRPLGRLAEGIHRLGRGEGESPLPVDRSDELGKVAQEFNDMAGRLRDAQRRLLAETERALELEQNARQAATLAVAGKLAAGLAHEVGTPLNIISGRAEFTLRSLPPDDPRREDLESIVKQIDRISRVITGLLDVVRPQAPKLEPLAVGDVVAELLPLLRHAARQRGIGLECTIAPGVSAVLGDAGQLQQVVMNLVVNALEATPHGRRVSIAVETQARDGRDGVALAVTDTGSGIAPDVLPRVFDAFFTTKPRGQGTGLGLAICRDIAKTHDGDILVESGAGAGSTFTLWVPAMAATA
jgi:two-component system NtrC family sensor kinase